VYLWCQDRFGISLGVVVITSVLCCIYLMFDFHHEHNDQYSLRFFCVSIVFRLCFDCVSIVFRLYFDCVSPMLTVTTNNGEVVSWGQRTQTATPPEQRTKRPAWRNVPWQVTLVRRFRIGRRQWRTVTTASCTRRRNAVWPTKTRAHEAAVGRSGSLDGHPT